MGEEIKKFVLEKMREGKLVVDTGEDLRSMDVKKFIEQPVDGILYDLNRLEETALTFMDDPKWVNDFAVALTIRELKSENAELKKYLKHARDDKEIRLGEIEGLEAKIVELREALRLFHSCMGDGGDLEHAAELLRVATNDHGVNQTYDNNPYAMSEQLEAMATFLHSEETSNENPPN